MIAQYPAQSIVKPASPASDPPPLLLELLDPLEEPLEEPLDDPLEEPLELDPLELLPPLELLELLELLDPLELLPPSEPPLPDPLPLEAPELELPASLPFEVLLSLLHPSHRAAENIPKTVPSPTACKGLIMVGITSRGRFYCSAPRGVNRCAYPGALPCGHISARARR